MEKNYRNVAKKITAVVLMMVIIICTQFGYTGAIKAKADDDIIATGYVNYDVTDLRIRTAPVNGSIITKVNGGFKFDIYEEVSTSAKIKSRIISQIIILRIILQHRIFQNHIKKA